MSNFRAAHPTNLSTPDWLSGTTFGSPVDPDVVSMNETSVCSTTRSAGGPGGGTDRVSPSGVRTYRQPPRENRAVSVRSANAGEGNRNGRPASTQASTSATAAGDLFASTPTGSSEPRSSPTS
jgi:hypothetical protein